MADKTNDFEDIFENNHSEKLNTSNSSKESEPENLDLIKKFIEEQQKNSLQIENVDNKDSSDQLNAMAVSTLDVIHRDHGETTSEANVMNMILSDADAKVALKKPEKVVRKSCSIPDKGTVALSVGSKVEAKDFSGMWYAAEIVEVDYDEMEVLVHYEISPKKHDEWISVSSSRLRPYNPTAIKVEPALQMAATPSTSADSSLSKDDKVEKKDVPTYVVGERCKARWRDNRRFMATVVTDLGNNQYEVVFDDGFHWKCSASKLFKAKDVPGKLLEQLSVDPAMSPSTSSLSPVVPGVGQTSSSPNLSMPVYHTHLFDPTRDYLGSKSERREMKRKLNIKEIFNIGQKKRKIKSPKEKTETTEKKPRVIKKKLKLNRFKKLDTEIKQEVPDAVASIIGTVEGVDTKDNKIEQSDEPVSTTIVEEGSDKITLDDLIDNKNDTFEGGLTTLSDLSDASEFNSSTDPVTKEEEKLEKFEKPDESKHEEVIDKMKEVISKLEGGLNQIEKVDSPKPEIEPEVIKVDPINTEVDINIADVDTVNVESTVNVEEVVDIKVELQPDEPVQIDTVGTSDANVSSVSEHAKMDKPKKSTKVKKTKKLRLLQEKKVKKQVEKVKNELEEMKRQVEEMRKQMLQKTEELSAEQSRSAVKEMPESFLLPGEWCCKWVDGEPVGRAQEADADAKVEANKAALPRKSVLVEDKRLPQGWKKMMVRRSLGQSAGKWDVVLISPDNKRFHTKHEMRHYLDQNDLQSLKPFEKGLLDFGVHLKLSRRMGWVSYTGNAPVTPTLVRNKKLGLKKDVKKLKIRKPKAFQVKEEEIPLAEESLNETQYPTIEDGYVYVGSLKVQVIDNLLRCPAEGCLKNFRNNTLIKMHIKHYHRELKKMLGATPKVLDLAYARTRPTAAEVKTKPTENKVIKVKIPRPPKQREEKPEIKETPPELRVNITPLPAEVIPKQEDSPKLRQALIPKPVKRPKVLLPVRRPDPEPVPENIKEEVETYDAPSQIEMEECVDFEAAISTHTVTKPVDSYKKAEKKRKLLPVKMAVSEEEEWLTMNSDYDTRSSFPGSATPDSKTMEKMPTPNPAASSESNEEQKESDMYMYTETGERIKIEHMKREEIINCHCGFREEDGLMVQCELCLCWQHALCHNIQKESEVPEKYTCSICLNPKRGRRSRRFLHDQDRLYEGLLPGAKPCEFLRRSHELSGNLLRIQDALHAMRVKYYVATKKDHPKLYLWAKDWENAEINFAQERLNSDYSDLNIIINNIGKENLPVKTQLDALDDDGRLTPRDPSQLNLSGTLSGIVPLDFPITTTDLERMARTMQEQEPRVVAPQPEAAIENSACRERLLRHVQRCQALIDARLDSIEAQVAELESQDPSFEDDETADYFPRTKQTIQMLMRDLDTMEELGVIT